MKVEILPAYFRHDSAARVAESSPRGEKASHGNISLNMLVDNLLQLFAQEGAGPGPSRSGNSTQSSQG